MSELIDDLKAIKDALETIEYVAHNDLKAAGMKSIWDLARYAQGPVDRALSSSPLPDARVKPVGDAWVPCSPAWIEAGGDCATAPRIWSEELKNHLHPALTHPAPDARRREALERLRRKVQRLHMDFADLRDRESGASRLQAQAALDTTSEVLRLINDDLPQESNGGALTSEPAK